MKTVSIISSPLQLLSFKEFIYHKKINDYYLIILYYYDNEFSQINNLAIFYNINIDFIIKGKKFFQYNKLKGLKNFFLNCDNLILGNFFSDPHLYLSNQLKPKQIYVLDDGMNTLLIHDKLKNNQKMLSSNLARDLIFFIFKIKTGYPKRFILFSFFNNEINKQINCIPNNLVFTRQIISNTEISDNSYFIGQPLVELGIMNIDQYIRYIEVIKNTYGNIIYIPSRKENKNKIEELVSKVEVKIFYPNVNIEMYFLLNKLVPKLVISFTSTALILIHKIFNSNTKLVSLKSIYFKLSDKRFSSDTYEKYYSLFKKNKIEILKLN